MNNITMQPQLASPAIKFAATAKAAPAARTAEVKFAGKENKGISVQSSAIVEKDPDTLGVQLYLQELGASEREVNAALHAKSETLVRAIKDLNIDGLTMKTTFSPVHPQYDYSQDRSKPTIKGYQGNFNVQLHITDRNSDKLPEAAAKLKTLATEKEVNFNGPQYGLKDRDEAVLEALEKAVQKAKAQAERLARAAGLQVQDKPAHIEVGASNDYGGGRGMRMAAMSMESAPGGGGASAESFQYEPIQVSSPNIVVRFAFKNEEPTP